MNTQRARTKDRLNEKFDRFMNMSEDELKAYRALWYPCGSDPISEMYNITALIKVVGHLRGFDVDKWEE